jgi:16S rRNA (guanine1516-N2)-methyltransferase
MPAWAAKVRLSVPPDTPSAIARPAIAFAEQWAIAPYAPDATADRDCFQLSYGMGAWQLHPPANNATFGKHPLVVDFVNNPRFAAPLLLREPLAKAAGLRANQRPLVIDLTVGLGRDAWALASTGCPVLAFERHPLVHFLLRDGLARALTHPAARRTAERITLHLGDARQHDVAIFERDLAAPPIWLLDPMFPERSKSALVKRDMRIFHYLVGEDLDASALFDWARAQAGSRWVVKRPPHAPAISKEMPAMQMHSGRLRFDCYLPFAAAAPKA